METLKKYSKQIIVALSALLFILCIWGPFYHSDIRGIDEDGKEFEGKNYSFSEFVEYNNTMAKYVKSAEETPGFVVFMMYALPLLCVAASAAAAFMPTFQPKAVIWTCRIAAIAVALWLLILIITTEGSLHAMIYFDILIAAAIAAGSFKFHKIETA